jgi:cytochrome b561|tara:strand:+ start:9585 stop:10136 length:552 start_codon:yes stop_codon:yes gene_type:complete
MIKNTSDRYGIIAVLIHWIMALVIIGMLCLGLWMVELDYYSPWYETGPDIHRSIGILIFLALIFRLFWRLTNIQPKPEPKLKTWEIRSAAAVHWLLYILIILIATTGYLLSTADGRSVLVFNWFSLPAKITSIPDQANLSGRLHYLLAISLMVLAGLHALAALKHHFYDKDKTLVRMFGKSDR